MQINGFTITHKTLEYLVFPGRGEDGKDLVLTFQPVTDYTEFEQQVLRPEPVYRQYADGRKEVDFTDETYKTELQEYSTKRTIWMVLKSLSATEGLVWNKVDLANSATWTNLDDELAEAGFLPSEINLIYDKVFMACGFNTKKIEEATDSFLAILKK